MLTRPPSFHTSLEVTEYKLNDLYFAAFLIVKTVPLLRTDGARGFRREFVFDVEGVDLAALKDGWFHGTAEVNASRYARQIKSLKAMLHS